MPTAYWMDAYTACAAHCLLLPTAYRLYIYRLPPDVPAYCLYSYCSTVQYINTCFSTVRTVPATSTYYLLPATRAIDTSATYYSTSAPSKVQNQNQNKPPPAPPARPK